MTSVEALRRVAQQAEENGELPFTVCGLWVDGEPVVAAVLFGHLQPADDPGYTDYERWLEHVYAETPELAEERAVAERRS